jgi:hypothetical protein
MSFAMTDSPENLHEAAWKRPLCAKAQNPAPRQMTGLFSQLTDEQKQMALNYKGPTNLGDPAFLIKNTRAGSR